MILGIASPTYAVDGVLEINQACAANTGCFSGDAAGFPVTITASGSYRLTGNLDMGVANAGIEIAAANVALDLNGFEIFVAGSGAGPAILSSAVNVSVRNGAFRSPGTVLASAILLSGYGSSVDEVTVSAGFTTGGGAIRLGSQCRLSRSCVIANSGDGVHVGNDCIVNDNVVVYNATSTGLGMIVGQHSTVTNNVVNANAIAGGSVANLVVGSHSTIVGNTANSAITGTGIISSDSVLRDNVASGNVVGISCSRCTLIGNVTNGNHITGIDVGSGGTVIGNTANENGTGILFSGAGAAGTVQQNTAVANSSFGFDAGMEISVGYSNNVFSDNNGGNAFSQVRGGTDLGMNLCGTTPGCP
jgi:parallel beta-helix repeat protein